MRDRKTWIELAKDAGDALLTWVLAFFGIKG